MILVQQVPPPPSRTAKMAPAPVGDTTVPLDVNTWVLLVIAIAIITYVTMPKFKKVS